MGELRTLRGVKAETPEKDGECSWCHKDYPCHGKGHDSFNCPRVEEIAFLDGEQVHYDKANEPVWTISAVRFKRPLEFECEVTGDPDAETA